MSELNRDALRAAVEEFIDAVDSWQQFGCRKEKATERIVSAYLAALPKQQAPEPGSIRKCLVCAYEKPWALWQDGICVCVDCRDRANGLALPKQEPSECFIERPPLPDPPKGK
jgi:hypothetical protein